MIHCRTCDSLILGGFRDAQNHGLEDHLDILVTDPGALVFETVTHA